MQLNCTLTRDVKLFAQHNVLAQFIRIIQPAHSFIHASNNRKHLKPLDLNKDLL